VVSRVATWMSISAAAVVGAALGGSAVYVGSDEFRYGGREHVDLGRWVQTGDPWTESLMPGARWATDQLCTWEVPCMQAVQSDTLTMYRFADREDAAAAARDWAGEAYLSGWIVVRFAPGGLTAAERRDLAAGLDCINVGVAEGGLEC
jgi:hypothetical protein